MCRGGRSCADPTLHPDAREHVTKRVASTKLGDETSRGPSGCPTALSPSGRPTCLVVVNYVLVAKRTAILGQQRCNNPRVCWELFQRDRTRHFPTSWCSMSPDRRLQTLFSTERRRSATTNGNPTHGRMVGPCLVAAEDMSALVQSRNDPE